MSIMGSEEDDESSKSVDEFENITPAKAKTFEDLSFSLDAQLISNLGTQGITVPTQVQREVISKIRDERGNDLCVNAPTGSGKTLAYALPIVQALSERLYTALGCVVVVPTRELVQQVKEVFDMCARKMDLKIEVALGQRILVEEHVNLVGPRFVFCCSIDN